MKEKLVIEGNAFYEIDLECEQRKRNRTDGQKKGKQNIHFQERDTICRKSDKTEF